MARKFKTLRIAEIALNLSNPDMCVFACGWIDGYYKSPPSVRVHFQTIYDNGWLEGAEVRQEEDALNAKVRENM